MKRKTLDKLPRKYINFNQKLPFIYVFFLINLPRKWNNQQ